MTLPPPTPGEQPRAVPLTVWPTRTASPPGCVTPAAAARAIATFSKPDDLVVVVDGPTVFRDAAAYLHRRYLAMSRDWLGTDDFGTPGIAGAAGLVIDHSAIGDPQTLLPRFIQTAGMLRPGGVLLTVHTPTGGHTDSLTVSIATGRAAGLRYLQHIILLAAPISGGQLHPAEKGRTPRGLLIPVHTDLAVFSAPGGSHG